MLAQPVLAAQDFYVVVPVPGRTGAALDITLVLNAGALPEGVVGQAYGGFDFASTLQVTGDKSFNGAGVSWSAVGLPAGLVLSAAGALSGSPAQAFSGQVQVTATYRGVSQTQDFPLTVTEDTATPVEEPPQAPTTGGSTTITEGQAVLTVSPVSVDFGTVARYADSTPIPVTIANTGTAPAALLVGSPLSTQFKLTHNCPASLAVDTSCQAQVVAKLSSTSKTSSFLVTLGTKTATVSLTAKSVNASVTLTHAPALVNNVQAFGVVAMGQFATATATLKNVSAYYPLSMTSAAAVGTGLANYLVTHDCPASLAPGGSCTVTTKYAPATAATHGAFARLTMNVSGGYRDIALSGTGAGALAVTTLSAQGATLSGGGVLTITGAGFMPGAKVHFGGTEVATTYVSTTSLSATVPAVSTEGDTWVKVVNPDGSNATAATVFKRVATFAKFPATQPVDFGNQPVGMASAWKNVSLTNSGYFSTDTFTISGIQVSGPYELYSPSSGYCAAGVTLSKTATCTVRLRFKPTAGGAQPGVVSVQGNGTTVNLAVTGTGSAWDAVPSSVGTSNVEIDGTAVISGNEGVGGGTQTSTLDVFLRNNSGTGQVAASFKLENGSAVKLTTVYKTTGTSMTTTGCAITGGVQTALCLADLVGSGTRIHLQVRMTFSSSVGLGSFDDTLIVSDAAGVEQYRIPLNLNVVYNAVTEVSSTFGTTVALPEGGLGFGDAPLATETYADVYLRNVGTNGMLLTRSVRLVGSAPELYFKSGISLYTASNAGAFGSCSTFVGASEVTNCLADDVNGGLQPHARIRVYFKPLKPGTYAGTLLVDQSGTGENPLQIPVSAGAPGTTQVFALTASATTAATMPEIVLPANFAVDGTNNSYTLLVYLNKTGGDGLVTGYFDLPEFENGKMALVSPQSIAPSGSTGYACNGTGGQSGLCAATSYYSNLRVGLVVYAALGEGNYTATLRFLDPMKDEVQSVPITVRVIHDATATLSSSASSTVSIPSGFNLGSATLPTAPGQVSTAVTKALYLRNTGLYGKLKVSRALIEGGDGAFSFPATSPMLKSYASGTLGCSAARVSPQELGGCVANDPSTASYQNVQVNIVYTPTQAGAQSATVSLWHNSKVAPNPLVVPLQGFGEQAYVAGALSSSGSGVVAPTGNFGTMAPSTSYTNQYVYVRNTGSFGALYAETVSLTGDSAFTMTSVLKTSALGGSTAACGAAIAADQRSSTACLSDNIDGGTYPHLRLIIRCQPASSGSFTGQLRVVTQGKEHLLPLTCGKN